MFYAGRPRFNPGQIMSQYYNWRPANSKSWNSALEWCQKHGGSLPTFASVEEVEQVLALMKYEDVPHTEALFIGLKLETFQVSNQVSIVSTATCQHVLVCVD